MRPFAALLLAAVAIAGARVVVAAPDARGGEDHPAIHARAELPQRLHDTGLYEAGPTTVSREVNLPFSPQYPLWSDGTGKRRWVYLPPGRTIDASRPDEWVFPIGTRLWKEFAYERPVETRMIERVADGTWRYASYVWNDDASEASLAPPEGAVVRLASGRNYTVPSRADCLACHEGQAVPVLGFSALQLSPDRDPLAPHADPARPEQVDLPRLASLRRLRGLPGDLLAKPPRIVAATPTARAALGYLHGNCGHCHNDAGPLAAVGLVLAQSAGNPAESAARARRSLVGHSSRYKPPGGKAAHRVAHAGDSVLTMRMRSTNPLARMPPLGVSVFDAEGIALVERWIRDDLQTQPEP